MTQRQATEHIQSVAGLDASEYACVLFQSGDVVTVQDTINSLKKILSLTRVFIGVLRA